MGTKKRIATAALCSARLFLSVPILFAPTVLAGSATWDGDSPVGVPGDGHSWSDANNWITNGIDDLAPPDTAPGADLYFGFGTVGTVTLGQNRFANSITFNNGFTLDSTGSKNVLTLATGVINILQDSRAVTINSMLASSSGLSVQGPDPQAVLSLTGANTFTGPVSLTDCTLQIQSDTNLGNASNPLSLSNATLGVSSSTTLARNLTVTGAGGTIYAAPGTSLTITGAISAGSAQLTLTGGGVLNLKGASTISTLSESSGMLVFKPATPAAISIGTLSLANGTLDLSNGDMILHSPGTTSVSSLIRSGFNQGAWNGSGITSSAAAIASNKDMALGYLLNNDGSSQPIVAAFDGQSVTDTDTLVKYTYFGDANLDGKVDGSDYSRIDSGFLTGATGWSNGDFNYDGVINGSDYTLIDNAFNLQSGTPAAQQTAEVSNAVTGRAVVPEPSDLLLCGASALLISRCRACGKGNSKKIG